MASETKKGGPEKSSYTHREITIGGEPCDDCYTHPRIRLQHTCSQPPCTMRTSICRNKRTSVCIYIYIGFRNALKRLFYIDIFIYIYIYIYINIGTCHVIPHRALCIYTYMRIDVYTHIYTRMYIYLYMRCMYVYVYMYVCCIDPASPASSTTSTTSTDPRGHFPKFQAPAPKFLNCKFPIPKFPTSKVPISKFQISKFSTSKFPNLEVESAYVLMRK